MLSDQGFLYDLQLYNVTSKKKKGTCPLLVVENDISINHRYQLSTIINHHYQMVSHSISPQWVSSSMTLNTPKQGPNIHLCKAFFGAALFLAHLLPRRGFGASHVDLGPIRLIIEVGIDTTKQTSLRFLRLPTCTHHLWSTNLVHLHVTMSNYT